LAKDRLTTEEININCCYAQSMSIWHFAAYGGELDIFCEIWECAEEILTTQEIKHEMLLRTEKWRNGVWQEGVREGILEMLLKTWGGAEEKLTTQ